VECNSFNYNQLIRNAMKRMVLLLLVFSIQAGIISAQKLIDIYKNGPVKLVADNAYGAKNNWETLFNLYYDTITKNVGPEVDKKIIVAPDGSVFMSHRNRHEIWKFGPDGNFLKKFGGKGGKEGTFSKMPLIYPITENRYLIVCGDVDGKIKFFDLEGNFIKSITRNFSIRNFQPLDDGNVLYEGNIMWRYEIPNSDYFGHKWRHIITRLNISTGEENVIYEYFENGDLLWKKSGDISASKMIPTPDNKKYLPNYMIFRRPEFTMFKNGQFIQSNKESGEVKLFNEDGKELSGFNLDIIPVKLTEQDALDNYESTKQSLMKSINYARLVRDSTRISKGERLTKPGTVIKAFPNSDEIIKRGEEALTKIEGYKDINNYFPHLPYFSNIIVHDEGNLIVFEFTSAKERQSNIFNVVAYDAKGQKMARTSFVCDDYDLSFSDSKFVIYKGHVYAVAKLKNTTGMPLRLAKFKITN